MTLIWDEKLFLMKQLGIKHLSLSSTWLAPEHQLSCCLATPKFNANFLYLTELLKVIIFNNFLKILNNELFNIPQKSSKCSLLPFHIQEFKCRKLYQWNLYYWAPKVICLLTLQESFLLSLKNCISSGRSPISAPLRRPSPNRQINMKNGTSGQAKLPKSIRLSQICSFFFFKCE